MKEDKYNEILLLRHDAAEKAGEGIKPEENPFAGETDELYGPLIHSLANIRLPEEQAKSCWTEIVKHKWCMSEQLGRNVGIRVAALDYFLNVKGIMQAPTIVEIREFADITWRAMTDSLTGLYNHRSFHTSVNRELKAAIEGNTVVSVVMLDIDFFKIYNDANGHVAGDVVIAEAAKIIKKHSLPGSLPARYGGEEFGIVLPRVPKPEASAAAEKIRAEFQEAEFANETVMPGGRITLSGGAATAPEDGSSRRGLVNAADSRLYRAKRSGRNSICSG